MEYFADQNFLGLFIKFFFKKKTMSFFSKSRVITEKHATWKVPHITELEFELDIFFQ